MSEKKTRQVSRYTDTMQISNLPDASVKNCLYIDMRRKSYGITVRDSHSGGTQFESFSIEFFLIVVIHTIPQLLFA